jgi:osmoprotectant transport system substrate-binding protein
VGERKRWVAVALIVFVVASCGGAGGSSIPPNPDALHDDAITIGSFDFVESIVLAEIYAQALESSGYRVIRQFDLGPRELVDPALERGLVELVPEYSGSALAFLGATSPHPTDVTDTHRSLVGAFEPRGITVLAASPAQDQNGFAVTAQTAADHHLESLNDLAPIAPTLTLGGPPECPQRPLCAAGLASTYGIHFQRFQPLDASGPITTGALLAGTVDVALLFTTDGDIDTNHFVLLADDRNLQSAENVTPVVNDDVARRFGPRVAEVVDDVSRLLTTSDLRSMNAAIAAGGTPKVEATTWLGAHGLV